MIKKGDILLLSFPFTNRTATKVRPALVISSEEFNKNRKDAIFIFITTKHYTTPFDLRIDKNSPDFQTTGLKESSTFRVSKIVTIEQKLVRRRLGYANPNIMSKINSRLKFLLDLP